MADHSDDKNFMATFGMVLLALVLLTVLLIFTGNLISSLTTREDANDLAVLQQRSAEALAPVGQVRVSGAAAAAGGEAVAALSPADAVAQYCGACHAAGVAGAPKLGDSADWGARYAALGLDGLVASVTNGKGAMPAKGGSPLDQAGLRDAVLYMLADAGVDVAEPAAEAAPETATEAAAEEPAAAEPADSAPVSAAFDVAAVAAELGVAAVAFDEEKARSGAAIYDQACSVCHAIGVAGSPKPGDVMAWKPRLEKGLDTLIAHANQGINGMPAKGGRMDLSDDAVAAAVHYMVSKTYGFSAQ